MGLMGWWGCEVDGLVINQLSEPQSGDLSTLYAACLP